MDFKMKLLKKAGAALALSLAAAGSAMATIPAIVGTTLTGVQTDGLAMIDLVWPVVVTIFGGMLLINIFKRAGSKV